jgi:hypothetical protein
MDFPLAAQLLSDDDVDDADDFDLDFDEDFEFLSDEEFEVFIEYDDYDANDLEIPHGEFCLDDLVDGFSEFDLFEESLMEKDEDHEP